MNFLSRISLTLAVFTRVALGAVGDVDPTFKPAFVSQNAGEGLVTITSAAVQPDGKIVVGGQFTSVNGKPRLNLARLNPDGSTDPGFSPEVRNTAVNCIVLQPDGKILIGGQIQSVDAVPHLGVARLNADGSLDSNFDSQVGFVQAMCLQADGKIIVVGSFSEVRSSASAANITRNCIVRLNDDGTVDSGFDPRASGSVNCIAVQPDGKIIIGGNFTELRPNGAASPTTRNFVARLNTDGTLDNAWNPGAMLPPETIGVYAVVILPNGNALLSGREMNSIVVKDDGTLDSGFSTTAPVNLVQSAGLQTDGRVILSGKNLFAGGGKPISRILADGSTDVEFSPKANGYVDGVMMQADGKVLLLGSFKNVDGIARAGIARLSNGPVEQSLNVPDLTRVEWFRSGSLPEVWRVTFEMSMDDGATWSLLGHGKRKGATSNWELTGLSLPTHAAIRARGYTLGGYDNGSSSIMELAAFSPYVITRDGEADTSTSATITATATANGLATDVKFQYSTDQTLASGVITSPAQTIGSAAKNVVVAETITGLLPHTTYYFRALASSFAGSVDDAIMSFTTPNTPPFAFADSVIIDSSVTTNVTLDPLDNDSDDDNDTLTITAVGAPKNGTAIINGTGDRILYTPGPTYATKGTDSFTYTISDGFGGTATRRISINADPLALRVGVFNALITDAGSNIRGTATITLNKNGAFTGSLTIDGERQPLKGTLDANGDFTSPDGVTLKVDLTTTSGRLGSFAFTGAVNPGSLTITGTHAAYATGEKPAETGTYTATIAPPAGGPTGTGWATMTVGKSGAVAAVGKLPDGTALSFSTTLVGASGETNQAIIGAVLKYPEKGSLAGRFVFQEVAGASDCAGDLRWTKPAQTTGTLFVGGFDLAPTKLTGSIYDAPSKGDRALNFSNGNITLSDGGLAGSIVKPLTVSVKNAVTIQLPNAEKIAVKFNAAAGTFAGSFTNIFPPATKPTLIKFNGVLMQKSNEASGYFIGNNDVGGVRILPAP